MTFPFARPVVCAAALALMATQGRATPIQVPASGQPILLMAERQTTGGYATIANVITVDLPVAGQLAPGDWIEFTPVTHAEAIAALRDREAALARGGP